MPQRSTKIYLSSSGSHLSYLWVYSILVLGVFLIKPSWVNSSQGNQVDILASFLLLPSQTLPLVMVGWTLIHEMYFYLVFSLVLMLVPEGFVAQIKFELGFSLTPYLSKNTLC